MTTEPTEPDLVLYHPEVADLAEEFIDRIFHDYDPARSDQTGRFMHRQPEHEPVALTPLPRRGRDLREVTEELVSVLERDANLRHPRYFGFIPGPAQSVSWLGDVIATAYNPHAGGWSLAPGSSAMEQQVVDWGCRAVGFTPLSEGGRAGGLIVSGGSLSILTGLMAGRHRHVPDDDIARAVAYISSQTHSSVKKSLWTLGIPNKRIRVIDVDADLRIRVPELRAAIEADRDAGLLPFTIVGTCGTTNTGAIDPLDALADLCEEFGLWFHVDGAYGASVVLSSHADEARGIERADSIGWDGHKWMFQTYGCALLLVRDVGTLTAAFSAGGEYLQDVEGVASYPDWWDLGPELTRPARAPRYWTTLHSVGTENLRAMVDSSIRVAERFEALIREVPEIEVVTPATLAIVCFRVRGDSEDEITRRNAALAEQLRVRDIAGIWSTELQGRNVLRLCTISPQETEEDIADLVTAIRELVRQA